MVEMLSGIFGKMFLKEGGKLSSAAYNVNVGNAALAVVSFMGRSGD